MNRKSMTRWLITGESGSIVMLASNSLRSLLKPLGRTDGLIHLSVPDSGSADADRGAAVAVYILGLGFRLFQAARRRRFA